MNVQQELQRIITRLTDKGLNSEIMIYHTPTPNVRDYTWVILMSNESRYDRIMSACRYSASGNTLEEAINNALIEMELS